uniref:Uncharacterized protein n=1 Tax=Zea mays TaxID=4577 RepID=B6TMD9_MAIZE|nr:hypothetical protein [Zea mays]
MLAVFDPTVAKCPEGLRSPPVAGAAAGAGGAGAGALMKGFSDSHPGLSCTQMLDGLYVCH